MTKALKAALAAAALVTASAAWATPSTTFWTPATTYTQPYLIPHLTYDTYVAEKGILQNTYGVTMGVLPFEKLQGEVGVDAFYPTISLRTNDFVQVNGKLTLPENAFADWQPGVSFGIANVGFKKDVSDYDLLHLTVAKTFPVIGNIGVGGYYGAGSKVLWTGSDAKVNRSGFMASWTSADIKIGKPGLDKIIFLADVATGKNWFGAVGGGIGLYFTPSIDVLTGPVYLLDENLYKANSMANTNFMWTVQLDVDMDFAAPKK
ncbi:hypothetical protein [Anaeromyxobacter oryzae]|uniref:Neuromedin U n=1 Tax=Anaeromyxobacter oryzae TaxID=2918170 RepID=A0ABN6MZE9_9BACT|nr:hypothetical protein [Anaeromyxobacter oryzae]BDG06339.1 hypothetical protein AMOR_53350 [Anaeromyxobacter oryzae]